MTTAATPALLRRPQLEERLDESFGKRLTLLVAEAGYGKSTLLAQWTDDVAHAWHTSSAVDRALDTFAGRLSEALGLDLGARSTAPAGDELIAAESLASLLAEALSSKLTHDLVLVVDDADELSASPASTRLLEALVRQAPTPLHVMIASRAPLALRTERARGQGALLELTSADLAFSRDEVKALIGEYLEGAAGIADDVHGLTGGWPAAVRLAVEHLRQHPAEERGSALAALREPGSPVFSYLAHEVFGEEDGETRELLRHAALLRRLTPGLATAMGVPDASARLEGLRRRGLLVLERGGWFTFHALVRDFALAEWPTRAAERDDLLRRAAAWFEHNGQLGDALRAYETAEAFDELRRLLVEQGAEIAHREGNEVVLQAARAVTAREDVPELGILIGDLLFDAGNAVDARTEYERAGGVQRARTSARLAWRLARTTHLLGDPGAAAAILAEVSDPAAALDDRAELLAWKATEAAALGSVDEARVLAEDALELAAECADGPARIDVYTAAAMVADRRGRRADRDALHAIALEAAERVGDSERTARVRTNVASTLMDQGDVRGAIAMLDEVIASAVSESSGYVLHALTNRGVARWMLGRLDEARADYEDLERATRGTSRQGFALIGLADVYRERGQAELARGTYTRALDLVEGTSAEVATLIPLCGLARSLVDADAGEAERLAERALALTTSERPWALNARGWVALAAGERVAAAQAAAEALTEARRRSFVYETGEALELIGCAAADREHAERALREALALWTDLGNPLHAAAVELALAATDAEPRDRRAAARAERVLRARGVRLSPTAPAGIFREVAAPAPAHAVVQTLGGFALLRDGRAIDDAEWQSRKARDLLKILVARRGRATPRDLLMEALWPDDDPSRLSNRLSVALSTLRAVLDPDKQFDPETFVTSGRESVSLTGDVLVDVETFMAEAEEGLALRAAGPSDDARLRLEYASSLYAGDFLDEDPYAEWAVALREEARAVAITIGHAQAEDALARSAPTDATQQYLRVLGRDPYDERAHLGLVRALVAARRHGEARRAYRAYVARMEEIGATPAGFPELSS